MAETKGIFLTRHIGKTTYKVRVHLSETANETMEDKILRLIRNDGLAMDGECGIINTEEAGTLLFSGVPAFFVILNSCWSTGQVKI